jgi:hypothetical protein
VHYGFFHWWFCNRNWWVYFGLPLGERLEKTPLFTFFFLTCKGTKKPNSTEKSPRLAFARLNRSTT